MSADNSDPFETREPFGCNCEVFELDDMTWTSRSRYGILGIDICHGYTKLPQEFAFATGHNFWQDVCNTVLACCPGAQRACARYGDICFDLVVKLGSNLDNNTYNQLAKQVKDALEKKAQQVYLRPGVARLQTMVTAYLADRKSMALALIEFQQQQGYHETKQFLTQYNSDLFPGR